MKILLTMLLFASGVFACVPCGAESPIRESHRTQQQELLRAKQQEQRELGFVFYESLKEPSNGTSLAVTHDLIGKLAHSDNALAYFLALLPRTISQSFTGSGGTFMRVPAAADEVIQNAAAIDSGARKVAMLAAQFEFAYSFNILAEGGASLLDIAVREVDVSLRSTVPGTLRVYRFELAKSYAPSNASADIQVKGLISSAGNVP
jgi:hypothetical protein